MDQNRQNREGAFEVKSILFSANHSFKYRIDGLQVGRVSSQVNFCLCPRFGSKDSLGAEVILHIASAVHGILGVTTFELLEYLRVRLTCDISQYIQAPTVRHSDTDLFQSIICGRGDNRVKEWNNRFAAL